MILPLLMGSLPGSSMPALCIDDGSYFWLGVIVATAVCIALLILAHHIFRR